MGLPPVPVYHLMGTILPRLKRAYGSSEPRNTGQALCRRPAPRPGTLPPPPHCPALAPPYTSAPTYTPSPGAPQGSIPPSGSPAPRHTEKSDLLLPSFLARQALPCLPPYTHQGPLGVEGWARGAQQPVLRDEFHTCAFQYTATGCVLFLTVTLLQLRSNLNRHMRLGAAAPIYTQRHRQRVWPLPLSSAGTFSNGHF